MDAAEASAARRGGPGAFAGTRARPVRARRRRLAGDARAASRRGRTL